MTCDHQYIFMRHTFLLLSVSILLTDYQNDLTQMIAGNMWLNDTIGVVPRNAWAIDPFGYSSTMAYLLRRMGFQNMLIQRTHYEVKKELALHKNLEYIWRQNWDVAETTDIFVHMMPFYSYDIPHTCGPEPAICCQFDFARTRGFNYEFCPWGKHPEEINSENVKERALLLLDQYKKKSTLYRTNTLLVPLGDDFRYVNAKEADAQFQNYEQLFEYINSNSTLNAQVQFGTLDDYFQTLRDEASRINYGRHDEVGSGEIEGFPSLSGDFFTYADRQQDYWSGYYVSRPFFKAVDRVLEQTLRASDILFGLVLGYCQNLPCTKLPFSFSYKLIAARRNLALFQHHDGVTGTAKNHVVEDYGVRMHTSLQDLQLFMSKAIEILLDHEKTDSVMQSMFEPEQVRSAYDVQPMHKSLSILDGHIHSVVLFNPLEQTRDEIVMTIVDKPDVCVFLTNWSCVESQISPEWKHDGMKLFSGKHRLYWKASVPAVGLQTYYIASGMSNCKTAKPAELRYSIDDAFTFACPIPYVCTKLVGDMAEINNNFQTLTFDVKYGLLQKTMYKDGSEIILSEEISMYSSYGSGAYLFKPTDEARSVIEGGGTLIISEGSHIKELYSYPKTEWNNPPISHSTRIYNGEGTVQGFLIEKEYHVEIGSHEFNDKEVIARFKTSINNQRVFYSDLNGFQMSRRERYNKIPLQGNYYPMPSLAFLQDPKGYRFSVHSRQSVGAASLKNGWLEMMLDRRLVNDDNRGLGQGVMDNRPMKMIFHIINELNNSVLDPATASSTASSLQPSILSHLVGAHLNYPMHAFVTKEQRKMLSLLSSSSPSKIFSPLQSPLPCDLHIVGFKIPRPLWFTHMSPTDLRFALIFQRRGWDSSYSKAGHVLQCSNLVDQPVDLFSMFKHLAVSNLKPTSLNFLHDDTDMLGYSHEQQQGHILLPPMELQAYKLDLRVRTDAI